MSYAQYLKELLLPLGVYDLKAPFNGGELDVEGQALDGVETALEEIRQESNLMTAQDWGLEKTARLLIRRPVSSTSQGLAAALAALLRISGDSFTLRAINDAIIGCGVEATVVENGVGTVTVSFPGVVGMPDGFDGMKKIIEDILPPHLDIQYWFWYLTWKEFEEKFTSWKVIEDHTMTWAEVEASVD